MNLNERAYDYLKAMILNGQLSPGVLYSETKLAEGIGISRTPMREAIVRLSQEGFLDIQQSKGFYLHTLTSADLKDMFQMRLALEGYALIELARHAHEAEAAERIAALEQNLARQFTLVSEKADANLLVQTDREFHMTMVAYMHNRTLESLYQNQVYRIQAFARRSFESAGRMEQTVEEHAVIVKALKSEDPVAAYRAASAHLDNLVHLMGPMIEREEAADTPLRRQIQFRNKLW